MEKNGLIYVGINLENGKKYVGCTRHTLETRLKYHFYDLKRGKRYAFNQALDKYGLSKFIFITIPISFEKMHHYEALAIRFLKTKSHQNGYNICDGGRGIKDYTGEIRKKISKNHADVSGEKNPMFGKKRTQKEKDNLSKMRTGKIVYIRTEETNQKLSISMKKYWASGLHTDRKRENHPRARAVILKSPNGTEYNLPCYHPFCKEYNLNPTRIRSVLQGKQQSHHGWSGRYIEK